MVLRCCQRNADHRMTFIFDGVVRFNCGECGKYLYHLVFQEVKYLTEDPAPITPEEQAQVTKRFSKKKAPELKKTAAQKAAEKLKKEEQQALLRLQEIRRAIMDAAAESEFAEL
jgi:hypothetical protein